MWPSRRTGLALPGPRRARPHTSLGWRSLRRAEAQSRCICRWERKKVAGIRTLLVGGFAHARVLLGGLARSGAALDGGVDGRRRSQDRSRRLCGAPPLVARRLAHRLSLHRGRGRRRPSVSCAGPDRGHRYADSQPANRGARRLLRQSAERVAREYRHRFRLVAGRPDVGRDGR